MVDVEHAHEAITGEQRRGESGRSATQDRRLARVQALVEQHIGEEATALVGLHPADDGAAPAELAGARLAVGAHERRHQHIRCIHSQEQRPAVGLEELDGEVHDALVERGALHGLAKRLSHREQHPQLLLGAPRGDDGVLPCQPRGARRVAEPRLEGRGRELEVTARQHGLVRTDGEGRDGVVLHAPNAQTDVAEAQRLTLLERRSPGDALVVDERAVLAVEVLDGEGLVLEVEQRMLPRDRRVEQRRAVLLAAAERVNAVVERHAARDCPVLSKDLELKAHRGAGRRHRHQR